MNPLAFVSRPGLMSRMIKIACAIFVTSYLLFDVLDLDGSQYSPTPLSRSKVFVEKNAAEIKPASLPNLCELKFCSVSKETPTVEVLASVILARELRYSGLKAYRRHRVALPRSSVTDSSSPAQA